MKQVVWFVAASGYRNGPFKSMSQAFEDLERLDRVSRKWYGVSIMRNSMVWPEYSKDMCASRRNYA